jgi:O-antigen ligase
VLVDTFFSSLVFFSIIGIFQFIFSRTLGGPLYLLGERSFNVSTPGIALIQILGRNFMRAYSTFSHPNSLAGYLGLGILVLLFAYSKKELSRRGLGILVICLSFLLTFSLSAIAGIVICSVLYMLIRRKYFKSAIFYIILSAFLLISLILPFVSTIVTHYKLNPPPNISQRLDLSAVAGGMISQRFLFGEGLNTFVINEPTIQRGGSYIWILQPVHNVFLLIFSETGIVGLSFIYFLLVKSVHKALRLNNLAFCLALVFILTTGLFDHYWFTLQQNMLLLAFLGGTSFAFEG